MSKTFLEIVRKQDLLISYYLPNALHGQVASVEIKVVSNISHM